MQTNNKWIDYFKKYITWIMLAINLAVILTIILTDDEYSAAFAPGQHIRPLWMAAACGIYLLSVALEGLQLKFILGRYAEKYSFWKSMRAALVTRYYSAITPACLGGQPAVLLRLISDGVQAKNAGMSVGVRVIFYQFGQLIDQLLMLLYLPRLSLTMGPVLWTALALGIVLGGALPLLLLLSLALPSWTRRGIHAVATAGHKLRLIGDTEGFCQMAEDKITPYRDSLYRLRPMDCAWVTLLAMVQVAVLSAVAYAACLACGTHIGLIDSICRMLTLNTAVNFLPIPGGMGAAEGSFYLIFGPVVPDGRIMLALVIWRAASYLFLLLAGVAESGLYALESSLRRRKAGQ